MTQQIILGLALIFVIYAMLQAGKGGGGDTHDKKDGKGKH